MRFPTPTPPPTVTSHKLLIIPYTYVLALVFLAVWQLIVFRDFLPYVASHLGGTVTSKTITAAILLVSLEVFAVPFLLRLRLSPLARLCSAICALLVPITWSVVTMVTQTLDSPYLVAGIVFIVWGGTSFWVLGGQQALRVKL
jgi:hypothetical protein